MKNFNGWQRLWILVVSVYLFVVIFSSLVSYPQKEPILQDWAYAILDHEKKYDSSISGAENWRIRQMYLEKGATDKQFIEKLRENSIKKSNEYKLEFQSIDKQFQAKMDKLNAKQNKHIGNSILFWILPSISLYILGIAIGWIYKGFKADLKNDKL